jgi:hypothetical protein
VRAPRHLFSSGLCPSSVRQPKLLSLPVVLSSNQSNLVFIRNRLFGFPIGPVGGTITDMIDVNDLAEVVWPVLSENHIRTYWWCSPPSIGTEMMQPDRGTAV